MPEADDIELVKQFARDNSEAAFAALVGRYVNLVYSVALRRIGNSHAAEEITQAVFIILARKAKSLSPKTILSGWLHHAARLTAANYLRAEIRRHRHEQEAYMQSTLIESTDDNVWRELAPLLDEAIGRLHNQDRDALILRYFENKSLSEVGTALGIKERAAQKRVNRAVEKLRKYFFRSGIPSTTTVIAGVISANSIQAAPVALAKAVTSAVLTKGTAGGSSTLLINATLKLMAWSKAKMAVAAGAAVLLVGSVVTTTLFKSNQADDYERYQITGDITYQVYHPPVNWACNFMLVVNGSNWAIHLTGLFEPNPSTKYEDEVHLNDSVYVYSYLGKPPTDSPARNSGEASIYRRQTAVLATTPLAYYAWIGLASGDYFSRLTNNEIESSMPIPELPVLVPVLRGLTARWQINNQFPYLPESIDFYQGPVESILHRPDAVVHPWDNGWKADELRVLQETNITGEIFPLVYTYEGFNPNLKSNVVEPSVLATVHVRTIQLHSVPTVRTPKMKGETFVTDYRISDALRNPGMYTTTEEHLPEKPDLEAIQKFRQQMTPHLPTASHP
jgi:RNA polymerase sigma factor (sigma-70 family)